MFDLSEIVDFSVEKNITTIDIKSAQLGQLSNTLLDRISSPLISNIHVVSDSLIQISLHQPNPIQSFALNPHAGASHRFVLDIMNNLETHSDIADNTEQSEFDNETDSAANNETDNVQSNGLEFELSEMTKNDALTLFEQAAKAIREKVIQGHLSLRDASEQLIQKRKEIVDIMKWSTNFGHPS